MDPIRWKQIDELVDAAMELPEAERVAFVSKNCNGDDDLRLSVTQLLAAQSRTDDFLNHSAMGIAAKAIASDTPRDKQASLLNKTIAKYKIERLIGSGGMGEVYLAFDETLKRKVAIKILPAEFGTDKERVRRFELEARTISKLNHPNIVTIYDVGHFDGMNYIATEFVDGKTLRELIGGKFKLRNVMANSIQICDALSAAHQEGIIHRDIKPENVMIRKDGYAKILDFGVAKLTEMGSGTMHKFGNTTKGMVIGTPAYMSPAQVSGDEIDHRTDIWSCGVVLYEFLTGKHPFKGSNRQETFQAILTKDATSPSSLNPDIPEELDKVLAKCLRKDPDVSYQSAADLRADLRLIKRELDSSLSTWSGEFSTPTSITKKLWKRPKVIFAALVVSILIIAAMLSIYFFAIRTTSIKGPDWASARSIPLTNARGTEYFPSFAPDGKSIVYAAEENGNYDIFLLRVGSKKPRNLTPESNADDTMPAFSPDGETIAFRSEREPKGIYTIDISGDNSKRIADFGFHPSWSPDGKQIVVSTFGRDQPTVRATSRDGLFIIDVQSGAKREILPMEATFPSWSPNNHRIAYWFYTGTFSRRDIATIPVGGGEPVVIARDFAISNWNPVWSPDGKFLYFVSSRGGNMNFWRVAIDEISGKPLGDPEPVVTPSTFSRHLTFSHDGKRMAYVQTANMSNIQGIDFDMKSLKPVGEPYWITQGDREIARPELSFDGTQFVMRLNRRTQDDIVTVSRDGRDWRDVTNDEPFDRYVRWAPDGRRIAFSSDRNGGGQIWISNTDGTGLRQFTDNPPVEFITGFPIWSPDGKKIIVHFDGKNFIYSPDVPITEQQPVVLPTVEGSRRIVIWDWSPDGKKLAGMMAGFDGKTDLVIYSFETNQFETIVRNRDLLPTWLPDSRNIVFSDRHSISIIDTQTKAVRKIFENQNLDIRSPFVSHDGKLLYYSGGNLESDVYMLDMTATP